MEEGGKIIFPWGAYTLNAKEISVVKIFITIKTITCGQLQHEMEKARG